MFTGKLSDFVGLFSLPIFLALVFTKTRKWIASIIGCLFIIWKLPLADPFIAYWNAFNIVEISRAIDYSDYLALTMIPLAHRINISDSILATRSLLKTSMNQASLATMMILSVVIFCSTSMREPAFPIGDILIDDTYQIKDISEESIIKQLKDQGLTISIDSVLYTARNRKRIKPYYQIDQWISNYDNKIDTLYDINFWIYKAPRKSTIYIMNCSVSNDLELQDWKNLKWKTKYYKRLLKRNLFNKLESDNKS